MILIIHFNYTDETTCVSIFIMSSLYFCSFRNAVTNFSLKEIEIETIISFLTQDLFVCI